jgi:hypothetical protein
MIIVSQWSVFWADTVVLKIKRERSAPWRAVFHRFKLMFLASTEVDKDKSHLVVLGY